MLRRSQLRRTSLLGLWGGLLIAIFLGMNVPGTGAPASDLCPQPARTQFFLHVRGAVTINGAPAEVDTIVAAYSPRGDLVGCEVVTEAGRFPLIRVYGEQTVNEELIPGMRAGEVLTFRVKGYPALAQPETVWVNDRSLELEVVLSVEGVPTPTPTEPSAPTATSTPIGDGNDPPGPPAAPTPTPTSTVTPEDMDPVARTPTSSPTATPTPLLDVDIELPLPTETPTPVDRDDGVIPTSTLPPTQTPTPSNRLDEPLPTHTPLPDRDSGGPIPPTSTPTPEPPLDTGRLSVSVSAMGALIQGRLNDFDLELRFDRDQQRPDLHLSIMPMNDRPAELDSRSIALVFALTMVDDAGRPAGRLQIPAALRIRINEGQIGGNLASVHDLVLYGRDDISYVWFPLFPDKAGDGDFLHASVYTSGQYAILVQTHHELYLPQIAP